MLTVRLLGDVVIRWSIDIGRPVTWRDIVSQRRDTWTCHCRQLVMWLARHRTSRSYPQIGQAIGGRDHSGVMHGVGRIDDLIKLGDADVIGHTTALTIAADALERLGLRTDRTARDLDAVAIAARALDRAGGAASLTADEIVTLAAAYSNARETIATDELADHWVGLVAAVDALTAAMDEAALRKGTPSEPTAISRLMRARDALTAARRRVCEIHQRTEAGQLLAAE